MLDFFNYQDYLKQKIIDINPIIVARDMLKDISTNDADLWFQSFIWEHGGGTYDVYKKYVTVKRLEQKTGLPSEKMYQNWKKGELHYRNSDINEQLNEYLKIRKYIEI